MVKGFDVLKNGLSSLRTRLVHLSFGTFRFERTEKTFHHGVVVAISLATHT